MRIYKFTNVSHDIAGDLYGGGMSIIVANNKQECIDLMNQDKHWHSCWNKDNTEIMELEGLEYVKPIEEPAILVSEWYIE